MCNESKPIVAFVRVWHRVDQSTYAGHDGHRSVPHRLHLSQPARFEPARHQKRVSAGKHQVGKRFVVSLDKREMIGMLVGHPMEFRCKHGIS